MTRALSARLQKMERHYTQLDPFAGLPPCIQAWRRGAGPPPPFRCLDRLLWKLFCIQDRPRPMPIVQREMQTVCGVIFDALHTWEPAVPSRNLEDAALNIAALCQRSPGWRCLFLNVWQLEACLRRHHQHPFFNGSLPLPEMSTVDTSGGGAPMLAGTVRLLVMADLSAAEQQDPFLHARPCHPHL